MNKPLIIVAVVVGILLIGLSFVYFLKPANSLPHFLPGYDPTLSKHHVKHGIAALLLGLASFAYVWFGSSKKSPEKEDQ